MTVVIGETRALSLGLGVWTWHTPGGRSKGGVDFAAPLGIVSRATILTLEEIPGVVDGHHLLVVTMSVIRMPFLGGGKVGVAEGFLVLDRAVKLKSRIVVDKLLIRIHGDGYARWKE